MTIYCDLNGVLMDFDKSAAQVKKLSNGIVNSSETFWNHVDDSYPTFWEDIEFTKWGQTLWEILSIYDPIILTSITTRTSSSYAGKLKWIEKNLGDNVPVLVIQKRFKHKLCLTSNDIIIDDNLDVLNKWKSAEGISIYGGEGCDMSNIIKEL